MSGVVFSAVSARCARRPLRPAIPGHRGLRPATPPPGTRPPAPRRRPHHDPVGAAHPARVVPRGRGAALRPARTPASTTPGTRPTVAGVNQLCILGDGFSGTGPGPHAPGRGADRYRYAGALEE